MISYKHSKACLRNQVFNAFKIDSYLKFHDEISRIKHKYGIDNKDIYQLAIEAGVEFDED
jgi:hypothetical protein